jgi:hypothetical protein
MLMAMQSRQPQSRRGSVMVPVREADVKEEKIDEILSGQRDLFGRLQFTSNKPLGALNDDGNFARVAKESAIAYRATMKCVACSRAVSTEVAKSFVKLADGSRAWHVECFRCTKCRKLLLEWEDLHGADGDDDIDLEREIDELRRKPKVAWTGCGVGEGNKWRERQTMPFCMGCHAEFYPKCLACDVPIQNIEEAVNIEGAVYHSGCVQCCACNKHFEASGGDDFFAKVNLFCVDFKFCLLTHEYGTTGPTYLLQAMLCQQAL